MELDEYESKINDLYMKTLQRRSDYMGRKNYTALYKEYLNTGGNSGLSLEEIENILYDSEEYKEKFKPKPTPKEATHTSDGVPLSPPSVATPKKPKPTVSPAVPKPGPKPQLAKPPVAKPTGPKPPVAAKPPSHWPKPPVAVTKPPGTVPKKEQPKEKVRIIQNERSKVHVLMLCRDNEDSLPSTFESLDILEKKCSDKYEFYYWILENDSKDRSSSLVSDFMKNKNGRWCTGTMNNKKWGDIKHKGRVEDMVMYRNMNKRMIEFGPMRPGALPMDINDLYILQDVRNIRMNEWDPWSSKYSIVLDTQITFDNDIFDSMEKVLRTNNDVAMVTPFGYVKNSPMTYYDTYALSDMKGSSKPDPKWVKTTDKTKTFEVQSAFGGFVMIKSGTLRKCKWGVINRDCSEHNAFCDAIAKTGAKVVVCPGVKVGWVR